MAIEKPGWPEHRCRCAPPVRVVGRRLRQEDALRERRGGAIVRSGPGAPRGFQIPSSDGRPLAPFQIGTISLNPLIPPHTHLLPPSCSLKQTPVLKFHSSLQVLGFTEGEYLGIQSDMTLSLQNRSEEQDVVCRCNNQDAFSVHPYCSRGIQLEMNEHPIRPFCSPKNNISRFYFALWPLIMK